MIIGGSGSRKTNESLNLIKEQDDIDKIYFYVKDLSEPKYEVLIKKREDGGTKHFKCIYWVLKYNGWRLWKYWWLQHKRKILIVFDDMIADIITNKKIEAIIKELFIRCRKLNISLVLITQSYFSVPKDVGGNSIYYLIMKINNKRELQNIVCNKSFCRYWLQRFCNKDLQRMHKKTVFFFDN